MKKLSQLQVFSLLDTCSASHWQQLSQHLQAQQIQFAEGDVLTSYVLLVFDESVNDQKLNSLLANCIQNRQRVICCCMSSTELSFATVWRWHQSGAEEVLSGQDLPGIAAKVVARIQRWEKTEELMNACLRGEDLVGEGEAFLSALRRIVEAAYFSDMTMLIQGESGTGKELIAQLVHKLDRRREKEDLVVVDCSSIVPELSGSEFFGHEKGAFTGAISTREGAFALANNGTLFLDEIGELPLRLQAELLRVIQEGFFKRVGSNEWRKTQFRLVCATNRDLEVEVQAGRFRQDLYFRVAAFVCTLPPLRERKEDLPQLIRFFLHKALPDKSIPRMDPALLEFLRSKEYLGNIRELKQLVNNMGYRYPGQGPLTLGDLPEAWSPRTESWTEWADDAFRKSIRKALLQGAGLKEIKRITAKTAMDMAIEHAGGNLQSAAKALQVSTRMIQAFQSGRHSESNFEFSEN